MGNVLASLAKAVGQLLDPAVVRVLAKSLAVTLAVFAVAGFALFLGLRAGFSYLGWDDSGFAGATAAVLIAAIGFWFLFRVVALAVLQFFADEIVAAVEARHYPDAAANAKAQPFRRDVGNAARGLTRALGYNLLALPLAVALAFTGIGPAVVFLLVNAVLLGRELTDMAWFRHCGDAPRDTPVAQTDRVILGGAVAGMMVVPGLGLLAPVIGAAAGTHVAHRAMGTGAMGTGAMGTGGDDAHEA